MSQVSVNLHLGDCLEVMKSIPDESVDAIVTDPPYYAIAKHRINEARLQIPLPYKGA